MNRRKVGLLSALVVLLVSISAFSAMGSAAQPPVPKVSEAETLYIAMQDDLPNLNYFDPQTNTVWKSNVIGWMYEGLLAYTPDFMIYTNLAESYELQSTPDEGDVATVVVHLRHNVTFHDGVEMTSKDVVFSYQVLYWDSLFQSSAKCLYWADAKWDRWDGNGKSHIGVEAVDDYTVKFHLSEQYPLFFYVTLGHPIIPEHIWKDHLTDAGTGDSQDMQLDYGYGKDTTEADATIGTGPWKFVDWIPKTYAVIEPYEGYWGKDMTVSWAGKDWPFYPKYVKRIVFKIYSTLDVAILALRQGEVDYIAWSITPGYYEALKDDPRIGFEVSTDQGFFYLAFNMRKAPMNDKPFRKAVAHCIDKDYIVDRLLHGYGIKGTVPIAITNPRYINESAIPPEFDLQKAKQVLDQAGYVDANGDGWRDMPDGSPIKLSILTPPKDYDPIRADSGIMISKNLKKVGLNIESSPTDFDTIVTKAFVTVQFDMYILGWAVGSFPENYLYDFFHSSQAAPAGYNAPGYSNPKVDQMLEQMMHEMDDEKRVKLIKDIEGILVDDLPYDVLYYRKNIEAYRQDKWQGWVSAFGSIYNGFSINTIHPPGVHEVTGPGKVGEHLFLVDAWVPPYAAPNQKVPVQVFVHNELNEPYANVDVEIYASTGVNVTGKTDENGFFTAEFTMPDVHATTGFTITAIYQSNNINATATTYVTTEILALSPAISASITVDSPVVNVDESTTFTVKVVDEQGNPVQGATVSIDENTMFGSVDATEKNTNENGEATFTYTAPSADLITNRNLGDLLKVHVDYNGLTFDTSYVIGVENDQETSWYMVNILDITDTVLAAGESANVTVQVTDMNGTPVANHDVCLAVGYGVDEFIVDTENVAVDASTKQTNASGMAVFTLTANANINDTRFVKAYVPDTYSTYDMEGIFVGNQSYVYTAMNSLQVIADKVVVGPYEDVTLTFKVLDENGNPVPNAEIWMKITQSDYGQPAYFSPGDYLWYVGAYSVVYTGGNGEATVTVYGVPLISDIVVPIVAWVNNTGYGPDAGFWTNLPLGTGAIQEILLKKAPIMTAEVSFDKLIVNPDDPTVTMNINVVGPSDAPVDATLYVEWSMGSVSTLQEINTDDEGSATLMIVAPTSEVNAQITGQIVLYSDTNALNVPITFALAYVADTDSYRSMVENSLFISLESTPAVDADGTASVQVKVTDINGNPVEGADVTIAGIDVANATVKTDANGIATFTYNVEDVPGYKLNLVTFTAKKEAKQSVPTTYAILVKGPYTTGSDIEKQISDLQQQIDNLTAKNEDLQKKLNDAQAQAQMYLIVMIVLIVIIIILGILLALKGKKAAPPAAAEETPPTTEETGITEETTEEAPPAEETAEEKPPEEGGL